MLASRMASGAYFSACISVACCRTFWAWIRSRDSFPEYTMLPIVGFPSWGAGWKTESVTGVLLAFLGGGAMEVKMMRSEGFKTSGYGSAVMRMPNSFWPVRYSALAGLAADDELAEVLGRAVAGHDPDDVRGHIAGEEQRRGKLLVRDLDLGLPVAIPHFRFGLGGRDADVGGQRQIDRLVVRELHGRDLHVGGRQGRRRAARRGSPERYTHRFRLGRVIAVLLEIVSKAAGTRKYIDRRSARQPNNLQ